MKQHSEQEKQTPPAPKRGMSDFRKALIWTAIPIVVLSAICIGGWMGGWQASLTIVPWFVLMFGPPGLWVLAILACIGFAIARKRQIALGILAGVGIGIVAVGLSCFAAITSALAS
jgi:hypothetical protein